MAARLVPRAAPWLAWGAFALTLVAAAAMVVFAILTSGASVPPDFANVGDIATNVADAILFVVIAGTGALIASRDRGNLIGWILCLAPIALSGTTAIESLYAYGRYVDPGALPAGRGLIWFANCAWVLGFVPLVTWVLLLFPDGHLPSRRWRPVGWLALASLSMGLLGYAFGPGPLTDYPVVTNPVGIHGPLGSILDAMQTLGLPLLALAAIGSAAALVLRFHRAQGAERQQLRWVAYAGAAAILLWMLGALLQSVVSQGSILVAAGLMLFPIAIAIAIRRYHLYDLDVVINRTLVYGFLTAALGAFYVGSVVLLGLALHSLTEGSHLAIAASTLAAAAVFGPLRDRIQELVDRRFYRRKYDAQRTLDAFGARVRREVDLDALRAELTGVVADTMSPAHVALYLRPPGGQQRAGTRREVAAR